MSPEVDRHLAGLDDELRPVAEKVRETIVDELPDAEEGFAWSRPVYKLNGRHVCYVTASKGHVTVGFNHGRSLTDPDGALEGEGKQMAHTKARSLDDLDEERLRGWLREARRLASE